MKYNLKQLKKEDQVIFKAFKEIPKYNVSFIKLTNRITDSKVYFLIHNAKTYEAYIDIEFLARKLELTKSQIFSLIDENSFLVDSYCYREGIHYYLSIDDALILVKESKVTNKDKHRNGLQRLFNAVLEQHAKSKGIS